MADAIRASAERAASTALPGDVSLLEFHQRLDRIEVLAEQIGRQAGIFEDVGAYVRDLRTEVSALYWIRWLAVGFAAAFVVFVNVGLFYVVKDQPVWLFINGAGAIAALGVATVGASVAILAIVLRGAFRTISERHADNLIPEHLKAVLEALKSVAGIVGK